MTIETLLVELFTEELPPKALQKLAEAFATEIYRGLESHDFLESGASKKVFASPRRLAVQITKVRAESLPKQVKTKLMPVSVALDKDGKATPALKKKLNTLGYQDDVDFDAILRESITREQDGKNEVLILNNIAVGVPLATRLSGAIDQAIAKLPIPKVMSYQLADGETTVQFVRPVHRLVAMHGGEIVPVGALGLTASNVTEGHRFQGQKIIAIETASDYEAQLEKVGNVIPSFEKRRAEIDRQLRTQAGEQNATLESGDTYQALLDEVSALVEMPTVYVGQFESVFLDVPQECLMLTMRANQKYFPLLDSAGKLTNKFLIVSNMRLDDATNIVSGNERVIRPRLADAKFFYDQDRKHSLESRLPKLASIVYHNKLGSMLDRVKRIEQIAAYIAKQVSSDHIELAKRAALLCKADLVTDMVGEFPELQGLMGGYYARHDGESESVALAIASQYKLSENESDSAENLTGQILFLAEKTETLIGIFGIGLAPTGDKDPFALRRSAFGVIDAFDLFGAIARQHGQPLTLKLQDLLKMGVSVFDGFSLKSDVIDEVVNFVYERYRNKLHLIFDRDAVEAVFAISPELDEIDKRIQAVTEFRKLVEAESLAAANKRIGNILKKANGVDVSTWSESLFLEPAEKELARALTNIRPIAQQSFASRQYADALTKLAALKTPVDQFFNDVMVMADDEKVRRNRLALLQDLYGLMNQVADISKLAS